MYHEMHPAVITVNKNFSWMFRKLENFFRDNGITTAPADFKVKTTDEFLAWFRACRTQLPQNYSLGAQGAKLIVLFESPAVDSWDGKLTGMHTAKESPKLYSDGHLHSMGLWRTLTEFVECLFIEWWALEGVKMTPQSKMAKRLYGPNATAVLPAQSGPSEVEEPGDAEDEDADSAVA